MNETKISIYKFNLRQISGSWTVRQLKMASFPYFGDTCVSVQFWITAKAILRISEFGYKPSVLYTPHWKFSLIWSSSLSSSLNIFVSISQIFWVFIIRIKVNFNIRFRFILFYFFRENKSYHKFKNQKNFSAYANFQFHEKNKNK